jgi:hypothetical protein
MQREREARFASAEAFKAALTQVAAALPSP